MSTSSALNPLSQQEWAILQQFLDSDKVDDALDIIETHGFLCSMAVGPMLLSDEEWQEFIFDTQPRFANPEEEKQIITLLIRLKDAIKHELISGNRLHIPCKLSLYPQPAEAPLRAWATGFMEGLMNAEEQWFATDEESMAQLTLPILVASGLAEEEEIIQLEKNQSLCDQLCREIPETLTDIFLFFQSSTRPNKHA
ncbi:MAG TPA: YecA family protein [Pseudomonadales bacterium]